jgi:hypothetical protein
MDEHGIESVLRRYRPVGPPADLQARILAARRTWPWAVAAAALLALTLGARTGVAGTIARFPVTPGPAHQAAAELTQLLGGDAMARQVVDLMLAEQQMLREFAREQ